ncbi:MAG: universal stress protein [Bacteroidales bacterium]|nr:universal stress protein [Bacteroidales bacterium]
MDYSRNKILVPVDFGENSDRIIEQSYSVAQVFDAEILLLHVIEDQAGVSKFISPEEYLNRLMGHAKKQFDYIENFVESSVAEARVPVSYIIKKGKVYEQIIETALDQDVILIVMGCDAGESKRSRLFLGSNTFNVVRGAHCPVITLKGNKVFPAFKNILVPLDFTGQTKKQVQKAIDFGKFLGATIHLISVTPDNHKIKKLMKNVQINQVRNAIARRGINCTTEIINDNNTSIAESICKRAAGKEADMIIIMTQQKKNFARFFVGSIAQEIIFMACVPVLSITPRAEFRPQVVTSFIDPLGLMNPKPKNE